MALRARRGLPWLAGGALALGGAWHAVISPLAPLARLEAAADDLRQSLLTPASRPPGPHPDILIVDIDEASLQTLGHWPWARARMAALSRELLQRQQVAALVFDFVFAEAAAQDEDLAAAWRGAPVVAGFYLHSTPVAGGSPYRSGQLPAPLAWWPTAAAAASAASWATTPPRAAPRGWPLWTGYAASLPTLAEAAPRAGFFNVLPDADGLVRSVPAAAVVQGQLQPSLVLATLRLLTSTPAAATQVLPELTPATPATDDSAAPELSALRLQAPGQPPRRLPLDERGQWRVPFRGPTGTQAGSFRYLSAASVLAGQLPAGSLAGRIVLVGSSAPGLADLRPTPAGSATPGVEVHAHLLAGLLEGWLPYRPAWAPGYEACLIALSLLLCGSATSRRSAPLALATAAAVLLLLVASNALLFRAAGLVLPVASALALGAALSLLLVGRNYLREWQGRRSLMQLFDQYLPPGRARQLAREGGSHQALEASNRELTLLFCDLQGFSGIAERLPPQALRELLNHYFSTATRIVHAHGGTLDKFIGDAVMAFWGAPVPQADHAARAVRAAHALLQALGPLNQTLRAQGLPAIRFGIGLATGVVCVGDLGSTLRRSYTAVGDAVNLAARLEALTRDIGVPLLVAESTRAACSPAQLPQLAWLEATQCQVRGRQQSVTVFTPALRTPEDAPGQGEQLRIWALALAAARSDDPTPARALLAELATLLPEDASPPPAPAELDTIGATLQALRRHLTDQLSGRRPAQQP